jgi:hypothetical protein
MEERSELVDPTYIEICKNTGREWILDVGDSAIESYMSGVGVERKSSRSSLEGEFDQHLTSHAQQLHLWK